MFREKMAGKSFKRYIAAWIMGFAFILTVLFAGFSLFYTYISSTNYGKLHINEVLQIAESVFEGAIDDFSSKLETLSNDREVVRKVSGDGIWASAISDKLYALLGNNHEVVSVHLVSRTGEISYSTKSIPNMYNPAKFSYLSIFNGDDNSFGVSLYPNIFEWNNRMSNAFSLVKKVYYNNELTGYIIMDFSVNYLKKIFESFEESYPSRIKIAIFSGNGSGIYNNTDFTNRNVRINSLFVERNKELIDRDYLYESRNSRKNDIVYMGFMEKKYVKSDIRLLSIAILSALIPTILITLCIMFILTNRIVKPINRLVKKVSETKEADFPLEYTAESIEEIKTIESAFHSLIQRIEGYHKNDMEKVEQLRIAEVKALQSQINPHFLYNTLDAIKWEAKLNKLDKIARIATELGGVLKYGMNLNSSVVTVEEELKLIKSYIYIQKERYGNRFVFLENIDKEVYECFLPKLLLQPLVENAVVHGMEVISEKGRVEIEGHIEDDYLIFNVKDNGNGFAVEFEKIINGESGGGRESIGLSNVEKRIKLYYGEEFGLKLLKSSENETDIEVKILKTPNDLGKGRGNVQNSNSGR